MKTYEITEYTHKSGSSHETHHILEVGDSFQWDDENGGGIALLIKRLDGKKQAVLLAGQEPDYTGSYQDEGGSATIILTPTRFPEPSGGTVTRNHPDIVDDDTGTFTAIQHN